ncbi:MAG: class II fumarate hydratase [Phycisphaerales bacterium]|nr:class II fumarate hydratase [Planctomycetota bacterium]MBL6997795.1 class II fumarate hydratase [Phycisphaerales bacterium]
MAKRKTKTRIERDSMGEMEVPSHVLFGATTQRALLNFPISGRTLPPSLICAFALLKRSAAVVNHKLKLLDQRRARYIADACDGILDVFDDPNRVDGMMDHFPLDIFQTGSGTSTNMNVNEVISNIACREAGKPIGAKDPIHPNDHVNMGQSSNDTFPTAMQIAACIDIKTLLIPKLKSMRKSLKAKEKKWDKIVTIGRTHLMDATPIRVGQIFSGYVAAIDYGICRAERAMMRLAENLPIGGTAVGTGMNTHSRFASMVCKELKKSTRISFQEASNHFEAQSTRDCVVEAHGELKTIATSMSKIANDIRWLGSGPRCGLFLLSLPAVQPGSSIMPGKVNPVISESAMQVFCQVVGNDVSITTAASGGIGSLLELNLCMPLIADRLIESILLLSQTAETLDEKLIQGLEINKEIAEGLVEQSLMIGTALAPIIGYDRAAQLAKEAFSTGETIRECVLRHNLLDEEELDEHLDFYAMTEPS